MHLLQDVQDEQASKFIRTDLESVHNVNSLVHCFLEIALILLLFEYCYLIISELPKGS